MSKDPGFKSVEASIERREGVSKRVAGAELASAGRKASAAAKRASPRLDKIKGAKKR